MAGLTAAGTIVILAAVAGYVAGRTEPGITGQQPFEEPQGGKEGLICAMRVGMAIFMGLVALISVLPYLELSSSARPLLLAIAGIGLTSAASVSSKHSLKNYMAIGGMIASLVGAYVQLDQAITATGNGDISAWDVFVAVSILWFTPFTILAALSHRVLRMFFAPALAAIVVVFITILVTVIPAILIVSGCNVGGSLQYAVAGVVSTIAVAAGVATFVIATLVLILRKREAQNVGG